MAKSTRTVADLYAADNGDAKLSVKLDGHTVKLTGELAEEPSAASVKELLDRQGLARLKVSPPKFKKGDRVTVAASKACKLETVKAMAEIAFGD